MLFITFVLWVVSFIFLKDKFKEKINPLIFIFHYFYGMLFFSQLSLTGIPVPTEITVLYFLIAYLSVLIGVLLNRGEAIKKNDCLERNYNFILHFIFILGVIPLSIVLYKNINFILNGYEHFVNSVRFERGSLSVAGSVTMTSIIDRVVRPLSVFSAIVGISFYFLNKKKILLFFGCYLLIAFSVLYVKRIDLMFLLVMFFSGFLASSKALNNDFYFKKYIYFVLMLCLIFVISYFRASSYGVYEMILHYGVGYHTFGFSLFDHAINNSSSHVHDWVVPGTTIFATFDFFISQIYKAFNVAYIPVSSYLYSEELGEYVFMGYNNFNGREISPNAFYTSLYPIYRDMKIFGLVLIPLVYGFLFSRFYRRFKVSNNLSNLAWVIYFSYVGYASLLTPVIMGNTFWIVPLLLFFFSKKVCFKTNKD